MKQIPSARFAIILPMFGSHLSIAGGMHNALLEAEGFGMQTVQVFTKNQQQWRSPPLKAEDIARWKEHSRRLDFRKTVSHDSYLINLASPDDQLWEKSIDLFVEEISRCDQLGIPYLVAHPGAHVGTGEPAGIRRIAAAIDRVHTALPSAKTITCLEITAGQGSTLGYRLEHLAEIIELVKSPRRLGVCLDTAHLFAAGYDFRANKYPVFRKELDKVVGLKQVKVLHLNDTAKELGSRVDRHAHIGHGNIGEAGFRPFVRDEAFAEIPKIMETPKGKAPDGKEWDAINLALLQQMMK